MIYYLGLIGYIAVCGLVFQAKKPYVEGNKRIYSFLITMLLILLSGLRHRLIGADTSNYMDDFDIAVRNRSWEELWEMLRSSIVHNNYEVRDVGYTIFVKATQLFIPNSRWYLIFIALLIMVPMGWWIRKKASDQFLSYIVFTCLFFSFYGLTGIRQVLALILVSIFGYELILKRRFLPYLLLVLLAALFHKTAIIMIPFYFVYNIRLKKTYWYIMIFGIFACFLLKNSIATILNRMGGYNYEQYEGAGTYVFSLLILVILMLCFLYYDKLIKQNPYNVHYINAVLIGCFVLPMSYINPTLFRLGYYYFIYLIMLIPELVNIFKEKKLVKILIFFAMLVTLFKNAVPYRFFWQ